MSGLDALKVFVNQRLAAALQEIFEHVDKSISEYEEQLLRRWRRTGKVSAAEPGPNDRQRESGSDPLLPTDTNESDWLTEKLRVLFRHSVPDQ